MSVVPGMAQPMNMQSLVMSLICCDGSDSQRKANENQKESNQIDT